MVPLTSDNKEYLMNQTVHQRNATGMLAALANTGKHVYQGTVPGAVRADRRRKNKAARLARRAARR
jgi:hypothetical protein